MTAAQKEWAGDGWNFETQLNPRASPVDDHASNGAAEAMAHSLEGLTKVASPNSPILPWLAQQILLRNRFVVRSTGRTPFEEFTMSKFKSPLLNFGEAILAKKSGSARGQTGFIVGSGHMDRTADEDK